MNEKRRNFIRHLPSTCSPFSVIYLSSRKLYVSSVMCISPGRPVDSILVNRGKKVIKFKSFRLVSIKAKSIGYLFASDTSLLQTSNLTRRVPTMPHSTVPVWMPTRIFTPSWRFKSNKRIADIMPMPISTQPTGGRERDAFVNWVEKCPSNEIQ